VIVERWRALGREVAVVGLARSGIAAARLLLREGISVYASDSADGPELDAQVAALRDAGAEVQLGGHDLGRVARAAAVVVSPGVPPTAPVLATAREAGIEIVSEIDVGYDRLRHTSFAAITGTNGKTTTTALTAHLLQGAGLRAVAAGNIGLPLAEVALQAESPAWIALEISSFQLHDTWHLVPRVGILTNLAPDHLDRYATLQEYYADKERLFLNARPESVWVVNRDDAAVLAMSEGRAGRRLRFSIRGTADAWYDPLTKRLMLGGAVLLPREDLLLLGDHNVANALAAALVAQTAGASLPAIAEGLRSFRALAHRLEPIREVDGVLWINDSKATNIASTAVALEALERPYVLLLGGRHKGEPYTALAERMRGQCRGVVAFGESRPLIVKDLQGRVPLAEGDTLTDVLRKARALARSGDAVLLSPACSSYDMFRNYEDRGAQFRAAVEAM
jgi:UDP-N-acetylmuramoylalanine--D-glutamate ligase